MWYLHRLVLEEQLEGGREPQRALIAVRVAPGLVIVTSRRRRLRWSRSARQPHGVQAYDLLSVEGPWHWAPQRRVGCRDVSS